MNAFTTIAALCGAAALPLIATETQASPPAATSAAHSTAPDKQEWERRFLDRISDKLIWNEDRTVAVGAIFTGGDHYHVVYWCFRESPDGSMKPFGCYSFASSVAMPMEESVTAEGLSITAATAQGRTFRHVYPFTNTLSLVRYEDASLSIRSEATMPPCFDGAPLYEDILDLNRA